MREPAAVDPADVRGLEELWARLTRRAAPDAPRRSWMAQKLLLDVLGIGLEPTMAYLGRATPDLATFGAWIVDQAGPPDPAVVDRYHAWLDGRRPPAPAQSELQALDEAPDVLGAADLAHWDEHGYVILRSAIDPADAQAVAEHLWSLIAGDPGDPDTWYGTRTNGIMIQAFQHPSMEAARRAPRVHKAFAQLWGTADLWGTVDRLSFNPPERDDRPFPGPHLHWDVSLAPLPVPFATQGILYLTDTAADQGALSLVPGFHHRLEDWLAGLPTGADPRREILHVEQVPIAAGAGDLVIWRQDLPHGASPNRSSRPRLAQYVNRYSASLVQSDEWR